MPEGLLTRAGWTAYALVQGWRQARIPFASPTAIERAQRRRVRRTVAHAYEHVPYYRETIDQLGLNAGEFTAESDLQRLPLITREQVQRDPEYFVSTAKPIDRWLEFRTGGSTGSPMTVYRDPFGLLQHAGFEQRLRSLMFKLVGRRRLRVLAIGTTTNPGLVASHATVARSLVPRSAYVVERLLSVFDPPESQLYAINEFRPDVIGSFGSYLEALFLHLHRTGQSLDGPKLVAYGGDGLSDGTRRLIQEEFGLQAFSSYGSVEAFHIGFECEQHRGHHLNVDICPVRLVDDSGRTVPHGESGEVVVSDLINRGTILLNYRLGDMASMVPGACPCGRSLPVLSYLEGRTDDWLLSPSGELRHPQTVRMLFTREPGVLRYQIVQRSESDISVSVVTEERCDRAPLRDRLARKFIDRIGDRTSIEISFVDALPRTRRGKVLTVVPRR
jgi:phenylacetate-CoA ligase